MNFYCDITKVNDEERLVEGYASTEAIDVQGEIVKLEAIEDALPEYMRFGNVREMHQPSAVGKAVSAEIDDHGLYLSVHVVDDNAWNKVKAGVYNGFSIGGKSLLKSGGIISKLKLTEISLVDRPANPEAVFNLWKGENMKDEVNDVKAEIEKSDNQLDILKGFIGEEVWDTTTALDALSSIMCLLGDEQREMEQSPEQIKALQDAVKALKAFIVSEIQEDNGSGEAEEETIEYAESVEDVVKSDEVEDIAKAGASISATNKGHLSTIIELCNKMMGSEDDTEKMEKSDNDFDIKKAFDAQAEEMQKMENAIKAKDEELELLKAMPAPTKLEAAIIAKGSEESNLIKGEDLTVQDLIKMAHQGGGKRLM